MAWGSRHVAETPPLCAGAASTTKTTHSERHDGIGRRLGPEPRDLPEELRPPPDQVIDVVGQHLIERVVAQA